MTHGPIDRDYLVRTCQALVGVNSINPTLQAGAPGEAEIAHLVAGELRDLGLQVRRYEPAPGRVSVVGRRPGTGGGRSLMLNAHVDTVGVEGMTDPFTAVVRDGRIYGRGAYDMKGSLACCLAAAKALGDATALRGDFIVAAVADEEYGSLGTSDLLTHLHPDGAIVTEPTSLAVCLAHKGYLWIEVRVRGRAAHGSRFDQGVDANLRMGRFLGRLERLERELRGRAPHPLVGPPSLHAAVLRGGSGLSTYAAESVLQIERRTVPGESEAQVVAELEDLLTELRAEEPGFEAEARTFFIRDPFEVAPQASVVRVLDQAVRDATGDEPRHIGDTPWMDAALYSAAGVETVVFGPHGAGAHAAEEWVSIDSMMQCADILARAAVAYCG